MDAHPSLRDLSCLIETSRSSDVHDYVPSWHLSRISTPQERDRILLCIRTTVWSNLLEWRNIVGPSACELCMFSRMTIWVVSHNFIDAWTKTLHSKNGLWKGNVCNRPLHLHEKKLSLVIRTAIVLSWILVLTQPRLHSLLLVHSNNFANLSAVTWPSKRQIRGVSSTQFLQISNSGYESGF